MLIGGINRLGTRRPCIGEKVGRLVLYWLGSLLESYMGTSKKGLKVTGLLPDWPTGHLLFCTFGAQLRPRLVNVPAFVTFMQPAAVIAVWTPGFIGSLINTSIKPPARVIVVTTRIRWSGVFRRFSLSLIGQNKRHYFHKGKLVLLPANNLAA